MESVHEEDREYVREAYQDLLAGQTRQRMEFRILLPDYSERWLRVKPLLIKEKGQRVLAGLAEDEKKEEERNAKELVRLGQRLLVWTGPSRPSNNCRVSFCSKIRRVYPASRVPRESSAIGLHSARSATDGPRAGISAVLPLRSGLKWPVALVAHPVMVRKRPGGLPDLRTYR
jgi:hypothetical protein